jgi:hypothetical protein
LQGLNPDAALNADGQIQGIDPEDYELVADIGQDGSDSGSASAPVPIGTSDYGEYYDYVRVPDPIFLAKDDEWLVALRQVSFVASTGLAHCKLMG